ncbi:MAG: NAD(+)/NADH kinase [Planctomycetes bacterium]|nr:NAD(+)/NADH kinase [Planctomycetota bacterium]
MRVLVVYKPSFLEAARPGRTSLRRIPAAQRQRLRQADVENRRTIQEAERFLRRRGVDCDLVMRARLAASVRYDLIVTVGGDGTFFMAARYAGRTPLFGINSDPRHSLGLFTAADRRTFPARLDRALEGRMPAVLLHRLRLYLNGRALKERILNDALFAHRTPAHISHYEIRVDGRPGEKQRSSGVWISTAAGSTAGIRAAGGRKMPVDSDRMQFLVREPYAWPYGYPRRVRGEARRSIDLTVFMNEATLWMDGSRARRELRLGDHVRLETGAEPAVVLGFDRDRRDRLFP